jgi:hypothetical protein
MLNKKKKNCFLKNKIGYYGMFVIDCVGRSEGLVLLWKEEAHVHIQNYSRRHINVTIKK